MSWHYTRFYLIVHICIGILIIGFELFYRWIIQTYQIHIRICPNVFYIEFKQLNKIQSLNWFENKIHNLFEVFYSINDQCLSKELKLNFHPIFIYLRYFWLSISCLYSCLVLKRAMKLEKFQINVAC
ncbi:unnamed protein product [Rotaria sp. Silwood1]|nr:unnamed protein product [Rotaria sp. Silwood1]CAF0989366.1 unnamed protein product [Rotaria sp. Silwood1]CAF0998297.1 unnamed protein product [Rotaria sp. Silwood1]CAF3385404.1 unnamed protein product [Rotaria sp. Silwood1]CAF3407346.1 unnamed protein product [Rotaria sp. Silwood1]